MKLASVAWLVAGLALTCGCGYHVAGKADLIPKDVHTIAVMPFGNSTPRYKLARMIPAEITQELITRTRYRIVADPAQADAVLSGALLNFVYYPIASDPSGHGQGAKAIISVTFTLTERSTGKVLLKRPVLEFGERYEVSSDPQQYFDESGTAFERVSRDVARTLVAAILEAF